MTAPDTPRPDRSTTYIAANPRNCLAFGTAFQNLAAAGLTFGKASERKEISPENLARQFGLEQG
ncbi:MAG: hypothetical protein GY874_06615 [Desulfobacteraceae bacterium]|nr:hypothetical protein [Desulfobacteraceae bacterium]